MPTSRPTPGRPPPGRSAVPRTDKPALASRIAERRDYGGRPRTSPPSRTIAQRILATNDTTLLDVVDNALTKGVALGGDLTLALAHVDLIYARFSLMLCAADRVLPPQRAKSAGGGRRLPT